MARESIRVEGLDGVLKTLRELPAEVVSVRGGPIRTALRKAGTIIQRQAKANVQAIVDAPNKDGRFVSTGLARKSIIVKRSRPLQGAKGEAVIVTVKRNKYPGRRLKRKGRKEADLQANDVLFMLEAGTERRAAMPWMRPAYEAKRTEALGVFVREIPVAIDKALKKLARRNGVKP